MCVCLWIHLLHQALAKIAVRSGEPFRVQCYQILAAAAGGSIAHRNSSSSRGGTAVNNSCAAAGGGGTGSTAVAQAADRVAAASAVAESAAGDPLGVAAVVGPALEVLDHMYASKWPQLVGVWAMRWWLGWGQAVGGSVCVG